MGIDSQNIFLFYVLGILLSFFYYQGEAFLINFHACHSLRCDDNSHQFMANHEQTESESPASFRLGYVTDVEGNLIYFLSFVEKCQVLTSSIKIDNGHIQQLTLSLIGDDSYFVYGGDACDKGNGDIRLIRALVDLKHQYPDRVFLLVGNRDLNKLRLTAELSHQDMSRDIDDIPPPHWDKNAPTLKEFLEEIRKQRSKETKIPSIEESNTRVNRLHYMLKHTLGCPGTFDFRKEELAIIQNRELRDITDEEVVDNFLYEVEKGSFFEYFQSANVAVVIGNCLFCHGAVDRNTMRYIPQNNTRFENPTSKPEPAQIVDSVHSWVDSLNNYLREGLKDYQERPHWNEQRNSRGGESLMALQNRPAMWGRSIVSNCYADGGCITSSHATDHRNDPQRLAMEETNPLVFEKVSSDPQDPVVASWLSSNGIQRVIVGHKPTGDCPAVLSCHYTGVEIVSADTSYSDTSAKDNRGKGVSVVEVFGASSVDNQLHLRGVLKNGESYSSKFHRLHSRNQVDARIGDPFLGRTVSDGSDWWVKVKTDEGKYYLTRGKGRQVEYRYVEESELLNHFDEEHSNRRKE